MLCGLLLALLHWPQVGQLAEVETLRRRNSLLQHLTTVHQLKGGLVTELQLVVVSRVVRRGNCCGHSNRVYPSLRLSTWNLAALQVTYLKGYWLKILKLYFPAQVVS